MYAFEEDVDVMECSACYSECKPAEDGLCAGCRRVAVARATRALPADDPYDDPIERRRGPETPRHPRTKTGQGKKQSWTSDQENQIRQLYKSYRNRHELSAGVTRLATNWSIPRYVILNYAVYHGLVTSSPKPWTQAELDLLREKVGTIPIKRLAKLFPGRSEGSLKMKLHAMGLSS